MLSPDFWKKYFTVYDTLNLSPAYQDFMTDLMVALMPAPGERILDAGVGTGNLAKMVIEKGASVTGVDFSPVALEMSKSKVPALETHEVDLHDGLPLFADASFDKIVSSNVLYNIPRDRREFVVHEFFRVLKPNGRVVLANVHHKFKPIIVLYRSILEGVHRWGILKTIQYVIVSIPATIKILYYNRIIQREYKQTTQNLFDMQEQKELLTKAGFHTPDSTRLSYSGQAVLDVGVK